MENLRETPLRELHARRGARFVPFGGWSLPVSFTGILDEYWAVRQTAGVFDVSHMGRLIVEGSEAGAFLDALLTQSFSDLEPGHGRYCVMCQPDGGIIDDVIGFRLASERYLVVVNGATREKDVRWIDHVQSRFADVQVRDLTLETAMIALQGPKAGDILKQIFQARGLSSDTILQAGRFQIAEIQSGEQIPLMVSTTGYTGEDGFEIYGDQETVRQLCDALLESGASPAGLGSRDLLRLEMGYLLYGQDATEENNPYEARLGWTVKLNKSGDFEGKQALEQKKQTGSERLLMGMVLEGRAVPRHGFEILKDGQTVGCVTSGSFSPWLKAPIALGYLDKSVAQVGRDVEITIRGKQVPARVVRPPLIDRSNPPVEDKK